MVSGDDVPNKTNPLVQSLEIKLRNMSRYSNIADLI